jgi:hypothetical protein
MRSALRQIKSDENLSKVFAIGAAPRNVGEIN